MRLPTAAPGRETGNHERILGADQPAPVCWRHWPSLPSGHIVDGRGSGLLVGLEFDRPVRPLQQAALERGLILINAGEHVLRICPPLTISSEELNLGLSILKDCLADIEEGG